MTLSLAVIGATGNVGRKVVGMLLDKKIACQTDLSLFASSKSAGKILTFGSDNFKVNDIQEIKFSQYQICIFNTESDVSEKYIPRALEAGAFVIDSSSKYRLSPKVPLIIPPVNLSLIRPDCKLYAHANCLASPIAIVIAPLHRYNPVQRINAVTYQSTSGAGKIASDECFQETKALVSGKAFTRNFFKKQIAFNVIPQVGEIMENGMTFEEFKIINEVKKVVDNDIKMTATAVRVPVITGHSIALNMEFQNQFEMLDYIKILESAPAIQFNNDYKTPIEVVGSDYVFIGRLRRDLSVQNGLHVWICSDNLRRGAATDTVEIVEELVKKIYKA